MWSHAECYVPRHCLWFAIVGCGRDGHIRHRNIATFRRNRVPGASRCKTVTSIRRHWFGARLVVLGSGFLAINTGLVLADAPINFSNGVQQLFGRTPEIAAYAVGADGIQRLVINVGNSSYSPSRLRAVAGVPTHLTFRTKESRGCTQVTVIPSLGVQLFLPNTGKETIDLGRPQTGSLRYTCGMGMYSGSIEFTDEQTWDGL